MASNTGPLGAQGRCNSSEPTSRCPSGRSAPEDSAREHGVERHLLDLLHRQLAAECSTERTIATNTTDGCAKRSNRWAAVRAPEPVPVRVLRRPATRCPCPRASSQTRWSAIGRSAQVNFQRRVRSSICSWIAGRGRRELVSHCSRRGSRSTHLRHDLGHALRGISGSVQSAESLFNAPQPRQVRQVLL